MFEINRKKNKILMLARDNTIFPKIVKGIDNPKGAIVIYSMWEGYLNDRFRDFCANKGLAIEQVHTSGHATVEDLKAFAKALNPKVLIPIHTFEASRYPDLFKNVKILKDKEELPQLNTNIFNGLFNLMLFIFMFSTYVRFPLYLFL